MKKDVNGVILDMTPEEEAEWYASQQPEQLPTVEDRVQILEEAIELLISGATE